MIKEIEKYHSIMKIIDDSHPMTLKERSSYSAYKDYACDYIIQQLIERPSEDPTQIVFEFLIKMNYFIALSNSNHLNDNFCFHVGRSVGNYIYYRILNGE